MGNINYLSRFKELSLFKKTLVIFILFFIMIFVTKLALNTKINLNKIELIND